MFTCFMMCATMSDLKVEPRVLFLDVAHDHSTDGKTLNKVGCLGKLHEACIVTNSYLWAVKLQF